MIVWTVNPNGNDTARSVPNISLIEFDTMPRQKSPQFLLKRPLAMMLLLILDISLDIKDVGLADGKRGVSVLPMDLELPFLISSTIFFKAWFRDRANSA
jgi:hypothetical protein